MILLSTTFNKIGAALTTPDSEYSLDNGAFADCAGEAQELGTTGHFYTEMTAAECTGNDVTFRCIAANANAIDYVERLLFEPSLDSGMAQSSGATSITLRSGASTTSDLYNGCTIEIVRGTGGGQVRTIVDYVGGTLVATVDRAWITNPDATSVYKVMAVPGGTYGTDIVQTVNADQIDGSTAAAAGVAATYKAIITGSVNDAAATTTSFIGDSGLSSSNDFYNKAIMEITSGTLAGMCNKISDYVGATRTFSFGTAWSSAPANGVTFTILGRIE